MGNLYTRSGIALMIGELTVEGCMIEESCDYVSSVVEYDRYIEIFSCLKSSMPQDFHESELYEVRV